MPAKKKARKPSFASRAKSATRTVYRTARRAAPRRGGMGTGHLLTKLIYGIAGYSIGPAIDESGLGTVIYNNVPGKAGKMIQDLTAAGGIGTGRSLSKVTGIGLVLHSLYKARNSSKPHVTNELAFGVGQMLDPGDNSSGYGSGSTMGSNDHWSC